MFNSRRAITCARDALNLTVSSNYATALRRRCDCAACFLPIYRAASPHGAVGGRAYSAAIDDIGSLIGSSARIALPIRHGPWIRTIQPGNAERTASAICSGLIGMVLN